MAPSDASAAAADEAACTGSMRATTWPVRTTSPSLTGRSISLPITAAPMSAYRAATISPDAVTNDCSVSTRSAGVTSTARVDALDLVA